MLTEKIDTDSTTNSLVSRTELVEIDHVTKSFGPKVALKDISFSVPSDRRNSAGQRKNTKLFYARQFKHVAAVTLSIETLLSPEYYM